jgi:hypothetical protein
MVQAAMGQLQDHSSPMPAAGKAVSMRDALVLTAAWVASDIVRVEQARRLTLYVAYAADASGTANRAQIRVMATAEDDADGSSPEVADDVWYAPALVDSTPTATLLTGTKETGATVTTTQPEHAVIVARPMAITLGEPSDAGTDVYRMCLTFDVTPYRWLYVAAKELGDTDAGDLGILGLKYSLSL